RAARPVPVAPPAVVRPKDADTKPPATGQSATSEAPPSAEPSQPAPLPASEEKEKQRAAEEAAHSDPFSVGGRSGRRAMAAATADESRAPRGREMTAGAPAGIPLVHAPRRPRPHRQTPGPAPPARGRWGPHPRVVQAVVRRCAVAAIHVFY